MLKILIQGKKVAHSSYKDMEELDFQILLTDNYYINTNSIHLYFAMKIRKATNEATDIEGNWVTVNDFFSHLIK